MTRKHPINIPVFDLVYQPICIIMSSTVPPTDAPGSQGSSWRGFAEAYVINLLTLMATAYLKDILKSGSFFLQCVIYVSFHMLLNFLYQKFQSL